MQFCSPLDVLIR